jgi:hypothetical protein
LPIPQVTSLSMGSSLSSSSSNSLLPSITSLQAGSLSRPTSAGAISAVSSQSPQSSAPVIIPQVSTPVGIYIERGCYIDLTGDGYPLINASSADVTTVPQCVEVCDSSINGTYIYAGVEGTTCFCANAIDSGAVIDTSACTQPCQGDPAHICGGSGTGPRLRRGGGGIVIYKVNLHFYFKQL